MLNQTRAKIVLLLNWSFYYSEMFLFIFLRCSSLFFITLLDLKSVLSDSNITAPTFLWLVFSCSFLLIYTFLPLFLFLEFFVNNPDCWSCFLGSEFCWLHLHDGIWHVLLFPVYKLIVKCEDHLSSWPLHLLFFGYKIFRVVWVNI